MKKGFYKHYKGGVYNVLGIAMHTETLEKLVLYEHKNYTNKDGYWVRPLKMFTEMVLLDDGKKVKRFKYVGKDAK